MKASETDDPGFIEQLNHLVSGLLTDHHPERLWIIQIDNWFDHKWLRFSGYGLVASNIPMERFDTVKDVFYQDKLTFPPFHPNRILAQWSFVRNEDGYTESPLPALPHGTERQSSNLNLLRRIEDFDRSACFVWYSSNTVGNGRGSVMAYHIEADRCGAWFAAFIRQETWKLQRTKGATLEEVESLLNT